jgi:predicted nucleotidyltransferase
MIKFKGLSEEETAALLPSEEKDLILVGYRGSIAHGTYRPSDHPSSVDDKDLMAIYVAPEQFYVGFGRGKDARDIKFDDYDMVHYELRKFVNLLMKANPNVMCMLWLENKHYVYKSALGREMIRIRDWFSSRKAYHSHTGYAYSQLHRMENMNFEGYMGEKRKRLVEAYGYDTKNASHLIRLLEMGIEFLTEGKLYVQRKNAAKLLDIKDGKWTLDQVKKEADRLFGAARFAYVNSPLPNEVDEGKIEDWLCNAITTTRGWV